MQSSKFFRARLGKLGGVLAGFFLMLASSSAAAQSYLIHAGEALLIPEQAPVRQVSIAVQDGRITSVERGYKTPDADTQLIDLSDRFVLPGLMDMHVHLTMNGFSMDFARTTQADLALLAAKNAAITLNAGFTTVRDVGSYDAESIIALRDAIDRGDLPGPRIYAAGQSISATAGHGDYRQLRSDFSQLILSNGLCDGADDCRRAVRDQYKLGANTIKLHATGGGADPNGHRDAAPEMFDDEMRAIVETAHALNLRVAAHAHGSAGIEAALRAGVDSIEHGSWLTDEIIALFQQTGAYLVPTAYLQDYFLGRSGIAAAVQDARRQRVSLMHPVLSRAFASGVRVAMGTDAGIMPHGQNAREIGKYVQLGMDENRAIASATVEAARLLQIDDQLGTLEPGKLADLIAVAASPLQDISELEQVIFVMKQGQIVRGP